MEQELLEDARVLEAGAPLVVAGRMVRRSEDGQRQVVYVVEGRVEPFPSALEALRYCQRARPSPA